MTCVKYTVGSLFQSLVKSVLPVKSIQLLLSKPNARSTCYKTKESFVCGKVEIIRSLEARSTTQPQPQPRHPPRTSAQAQEAPTQLPGVRVRIAATRRALYVKPYRLPAPPRKI